MTTQIAAAAIRQFARDSGISEGLLAQHQDLFETFALRVADYQRKKDANAVRAWFFNASVSKCQLFEILED